MATKEEMSARRWWLLCVIHNCVIHPWLPLADAIDAVSRIILGRPSRLAGALYTAHDRTAPPGGG